MNFQQVLPLAPPLGKSKTLWHGKTLTATQLWTYSTNSSNSIPRNESPPQTPSVIHTSPPPPPQPPPAEHPTVPTIPHPPHHLLLPGSALEEQCPHPHSISQFPNNNFNNSIITSPTVSINSLRSINKWLKWLNSILNRFNLGGFISPFPFLFPSLCRLVIIMVREEGCIRGCLGLPRGICNNNSNRWGFRRCMDRDWDRDKVRGRCRVSKLGLEGLRSRGGDSFR